MKDPSVDRKWEYKVTLRPLAVREWFVLWKLKLCCKDEWVEKVVVKDSGRQMQVL